MDLLRHLTFFVAVADAGQVGVGAAELGMTQPPVSQGLQRLERELGVRLFERNARGVVLTSAGRDLLPRARAILDQADELRAAATTGVQERITLRIGFVPQIPPAAAAEAAVSASKATEGQLAVVTGSTTGLLRLLNAGELDLAVIRHPAVLGPLTGGGVLRVPSVALIPSDQSSVGGGGARSSARAITLRSLADLPVATPAREDEPAAYDLLMDTLAEHGWFGRSVVAADERAALSLVAMGRAVAFSVERPAVSGVRVRRIDGDPLPLRLRPVWRDRDLEPAVVDAVMVRLRQELTP